MLHLILCQPKSNGLRTWRYCLNLKTCLYGLSTHLLSVLYTKNLSRIFKSSRELISGTARSSRGELSLIIPPLSLRHPIYDGSLNLFSEAVMNGHTWACYHLLNNSASRCQITGSNLDLLPRKPYITVHSENVTSQKNRNLQDRRNSCRKEIQKI